MRALNESFAAWIAIHQLRNENGFRRRSSSRCMSRTVTTSELLRGVGMGNVRGKSARRASMGEAETISRLRRVLSKAVDHVRVSERGSVALTKLPLSPW
jgi:cysteine sulfinate desulfinase/cysteine desulfurase-like protein